MILKRILCFSLASILMFSLYACGGKTDKPATQQEPLKPSIEKPSSEYVSSETGFSSLNNDMIAFFENKNVEKENFMISPLSFKYAIILATLGAEGETQAELLKALNFNTVDECLLWVENYNYILQEFETDAIKDANWGNKSPEKKPAERMLNIANSVWHNTNRKGNITKEYMDIVSQKLMAEAYNEKGADLTPKINAWVKEKTSNLIPSLTNISLDQANTILINTLYLKSAWLNPFDEKATIQDDFTTSNGSKVKKNFMTTTETFKYYKDEETEIIILPLEGNVKCTLVRGKTDNIYEKIQKAKSKAINLYMPKLEIESSFDKKEFVEFLASRGANLCFDMEKADFSKMIDEQIYIDDIIQKTKITTDENGLEAAAVTAVIMKDNCVISPEEPLIVKFDSAFSFYIYNQNTDGSPELLFYGNYQK